MHKNKTEKEIESLMDFEVRTSISFHKIKKVILNLIKKVKNHGRT